MGARIASFRDHCNMLIPDIKTATAFNTSVVCLPSLIPRPLPSFQQEAGQGPGNETSVFPGSILVKLEWHMKCECVDGTKRTDDAQALRKGPCMFTFEYGYK